MNSSRSHGFTIVELMTAIAVTSIVALGVVGLYISIISQTPLTATRNTLSTNLQNALNRISDDVRLSSNVAVHNSTPDPNAPTSLAGYTTVPGPTPDTDDKYFWRMGEHRLLLNQTPVDASGNPIYDNAKYAAGKKNTIIYYIRDGALYRRVIAADYPANTQKTYTCSRIATGGCESSDIKIIDNLDPDLGENAFSLVYYNVSGNPIPYAASDGSGGSVTDYSAFPLTRAIGVTIKLKSKAPVSSQPVSIENSMRMQFRSQYNIVPTDTPSPPVIPPTNTIGAPGLMAGPGGLYLTQATIGGGDVYVKGNITLRSSTIGAVSSWGSTTGPVNLNVSNIGCGTPPSYPSVCPGNAIIANNVYPSRVNGNVCATNQTDSTFIRTYGAMDKGLIPGCTPPTMDLPPFDKAGFTSSMTAGTRTGSSGSCGTSGNISTTADATYTGNVTWNTWCKVQLTGNMYVTGKLDINQATLTVSEALGRTRPIVVVNGQIDLYASTFKPNSYGTAPYFISFLSKDTACSNSPTCTTISSQDFYDTVVESSSSFIGTNNSPIIFRANGGNYPGASFYAFFGHVRVGAGGATIGAIAGQRIYLDTWTHIELSGSLGAL